MDFSRSSHKRDRETTTSYNVNLTFDMRTSNISNAPGNNPNIAIESHEGISKPSEIHVDHNYKPCNNCPLNNPSDLNQRNNTANIANVDNVTTSVCDAQNVLENMNQPSELNDLNQRNNTANIANVDNVTTSVRDGEKVNLINQE